MLEFFLGVYTRQKGTPENLAILLSDNMAKCFNCARAPRIRWQPTTTGGTPLGGTGARPGLVLQQISKTHLTSRKTKMCVNPVETLPWNRLGGGRGGEYLHNSRKNSLQYSERGNNQILPSTNCFSANDPVHGFWSPARNQITPVKYISDGGNLTSNLFEQLLPAVTKQPQEPSTCTLRNMVALDVCQRTSCGVA